MTNDQLRQFWAGELADGHHEQLRAFWLDERFEGKDAPKDDGRWITIGSDSEGGGGARVHLDSSGKIDKGPKSLTGKNIRHLDEHLPAEGQKDWNKAWQRLRRRINRRLRQPAGRKPKREPLGLNKRGERQNAYVARPGSYRQRRQLRGKQRLSARPCDNHRG